MSTPEDFSDLTARLRALSEERVAPHLADAHLAAMAEAPSPAARGSRWTKARVGLAFFAGLLLGGSGLASAGALPGPAQDVAHDVLGAVGVNVPRSTEGCPEGKEYRNHGEYVSEVSESGDEAATKAAAKSECGKPIKGAGADGTRRGPKSDNPCRPPWAGGPSSYPGLTPEQRRERRAADQASWTQPAECNDEAETEGAEAQTSAGSATSPEPAATDDPGTDDAVEPTTTTSTATTTTTTTTTTADPVPADEGS